MGMAHAWLLSKRNGRFLNRSLVLGSGLLFLLVGCGGGGGDGGGAGGVGGGTAPFTRTEAAVGDYFIYAMTSTTSVPAGEAPSAFNSTVAYSSMAGDGTNQRVTTWSTGQARGTKTYNANDAVVSHDGVCSFSPPNQEAPPYPRAVGQTWNGSSQFICRNYTATYVQTGQVVARESLVLPAGTFDAYRATRTSIATGPTGVYTENLTCWYGVDRGVLLRCDSTNSRTLAGSSTPDLVVSYTQALTGLGGPNRVAQGVRLPRFQGSWNIAYSGGASGACMMLSVSAGGEIAGSCANVGGASFSVAGTVNADGVVNIGLPGGGALSGNLSTIYSGSGAWSDAGITGTWTATHN